MTRRRPARRLARPLVPASPPPADAAAEGPVPGRGAVCPAPAQGPRPAPAPRAERVPVVLVLYGDGLAEVYADPDQASVVIVPMPAIPDWSRACVELAEELIELSVPWRHRQVLYPRCRRQVHVRNCPSIEDLQRILLDRAVHDELNRLIAKQSGDKRDG